jgi:hypothetical protein
LFFDNENTIGIDAPSFGQITSARGSDFWRLSHGAGFDALGVLVCGVRRGPLLALRDVPAQNRPAWSHSLSWESVGGSFQKHPHHLWWRLPEETTAFLPNWNSVAAGRSAAAVPNKVENQM